MPQIIFYFGQRRQLPFKSVKGFNIISLILSAWLCSAVFPVLGSSPEVIHAQQKMQTIALNSESGIATEDRKSEKGQSRVLAVIKYSLGFYIDDLILWEEPRVTFRHSADQQFVHFNEIVRHTLQLYEHPAADAFWGFSARVEKKLLSLHQMEGYRIDEVNRDAPANNEKIGRYQLKIQVNNLKKAAQQEAEEFIEENPSAIDREGRLLMSEESEEDRILRTLNDASKQEMALLIDSLFELDNVPEDFIARISDRINAMENLDTDPEFRKNQTLDPIVHLIETYEVEDNSELEINIPKTTSPETTTSLTDTENFNTRVLQLLEENNHLMSKYNDRFDYMQRQIDDLKDAQLNASLEREKHLQNQIDDIYAKIDHIGKATPDSPTHENLRPVEVIFERNNHSVTLFHQSVLNEVRAGMLKNPSYKLMITGFADRVGDRKYNILLSQKRAQSVYDYLLHNGIPANRMIINYLGDNQSDSLNPLDRKVEIEWLVNYSGNN